MKKIGKIIATEKVPTTVDDFFFWTDKELIIKPFDVIKVDHIKDSITFGVVEEISHLTDNSSFLAGYISSDFGDVAYQNYTQRIGMNYVKAKVIANDKGIYTPVLDGSSVSLASEEHVKEALGLKDVKNPLACGYIEMYEEPDRITIPVHFNSHFLIGPEGAHLNISGISGLASKTSYAMFLLKAIQDQYLGRNDGESVAYVLLNVKGRDLLAIDEPNDDLTEEEKRVYKKMLNLSTTPFQNVKYFYPYSKDIISSTYGRDVKSQMELGKASLYKYIFDEDKESIDLLFSNVDDPNQTMESIVNYIATGQGDFNGITNWNELLNVVQEHTKAGNTGKDKEITVLSWRKFYRLFRKTIEKTTIFSNSLSTKANDKETRLKSAILNIQKNDVFVVDIAKLDEETQGFVFGDVMRSIYELKLGQAYDRKEADIPSKIIIFIDELNKYASKEVPKSSPILRQLLDITERGRSLGIILFSAEQFKSDIHDRVKGNCATHAYGRTNAIEVSKPDYQYVPPVYKSMLTRLKQGEYVVQNPIFRSLLNIKFPRPIYKQFKNG
jgi:uncharacterized protein